MNGGEHISFDLKAIDDERRDIALSRVLLGMGHVKADTAQDKLAGSNEDSLDMDGVVEQLA